MYKQICYTLLLFTVLIASPVSGWSESNSFKPEGVGAPVRLVGGGTRGISIKPDKEVRSLIRASDGFAYLGEDMTIKQARRAAELDAKRAVLEGVSTYIESKSQVTDGMLDFDVIKSEAGGEVSVLEHKDYGLENGRYHYWIKAEVKYGMKPKKVVAAASSNSSLWSSSNAPLTVRVWSDHKVFKDGDMMVLFLEGNRDFYARVVDYMSDGSIVQLLPNTHRQDNFFKGGMVHKIPDYDKGDQFEMEIGPPYGTDRIVVYASNSPLGSVPTDDIGNGMRLYQGTQEQMSKKSRGVSIKAAKGGGKAVDENVEFIETVWEIDTTEK
ncbi:MAG: DUF4384 domain-containing protein [Magnetococcales bacterium]|nr:DUF4384 domain-containing protein [Magnetococcales bacterium]